MEDILLVDEDDNIIGKEEKLSAHKSGKLHRAFSVFVFNSKKELLIQKRAQGKYHSAGLWSNTCCSHPVTEDTKKEAEERLKEEMGFSCELEELFSFIYEIEFKNGLKEHEFDHVFKGKYNGPVMPNIKEVMNYKWVAPEKLHEDIKKNPGSYTHWLKLCLSRVISFS
ncbi:TPA: isopentenyl-diphosphate Delta-isomerase [Candidatus Woesearchaeota archaeon]|nr:Isopentenyl-diphosphate Delta-isomerase [archaeon GW2011_AR15]MBS3104144.1 isopentenyl-diphosphate Delta-isomerase [Candidatus Woesearchaeota archaeon]HIH41424.1 isopentenyl-diphosphate Delta-isomerase [Candidatus Woesearchaeota archaeon]